MKNRWLVGLATAALAVTMTFGFVACGDGDDAKTAKDAIDQVKSLYTNKPTEISDAAHPDRPEFQLIGKARVGENLYDIAWSATSTSVEDINNYVSFGTLDQNDMITVTCTRTTVDIDFALKASVTVGKVTETAQFQRKLPKILAAQEGELGYDFSSVELGSELNASSALALINSVGTEKDALDTVEVSKVYQGNTTGGGTNFENKGGFLKFGTGSADGVLTMNFKKNVSKITIEAQAWTGSLGSNGDNKQIKVNDLAAQDMSQESPALFAFELPAPTTSVTITTIHRAFVFKIVVAYAEGVHNHNYTYQHVEGSWNHTKTCTAENCPDGTEPITEPCTPDANKCLHCEYTYKVDEILNALKALASGSSLPGTYELTGKVTAIEEVSTQYGNATFTIEVNGESIGVYRAKGDGYENLKLSDIVTVVGGLENHSTGGLQVSSGGNITKIVDGASSMNDTEKVAETKKIVSTLIELSYNKTTETPIQLPTTSTYGASLTWTVETSTQLVSITDNKLTISSIPTSSTEIVLKVVITSGSVSDNAQVTITLAPAATAQHQGTESDPYTVADAIALISDLAANEYYKPNGSAVEPVYIKGIVTVAGTVSSNGNYIQKMYIADVKDDTDNDLYVYSVNFGEGVDAGTEIKVGDTVVILGYLQNYYGNTPEITSWKDDSSTYHNCYFKSHTPATVDPDEHVHIWVYTYANGLKHTKVCNEDGCDQKGVSITEACDCVANVCKHCNHTATQEEILTALKALTAGEKLTGTYSLQGKIVQEEKCKKGSSGDWQFYIDVDGTVIMVYYASHSAVDSNFDSTDTNPLKNNDVVTVVGQLLYYQPNSGDPYYEFNSGSEITAWQSASASMSPAEKVAAAKAAVEKGIIDKIYDAIVSDKNLPAEDNGATLTWSVKNNEHSDVVTITDNKLNISKLPDEELTVTLSVAIVCDSASDTAEFQITISAAPKADEKTYQVSATYTPFGRGYAQADVLDGVEGKIKDVTVTYAKGGSSNNPVFWTSEARVYHNATITVAVPSKYTITKITLTFTASDGNTVSANGGSMADKVWSGSAESVVFTVGAKSSGSNGGHIKLTKMVIEYTSPVEPCKHEQLTKKDGTPAQCEEDGIGDSWTCNSCHRMFKAETATDEDEIFVDVVLDALGHDFKVWTDDGDGLHHTSTCDRCKTETSQGVHDKDGEDGKCSKCGATVSGSVDPVVLATFDLGSSTSDSGTDYNSTNRVYTESNNGYTLTVDNPSKVYPGKGGTLKLGTSSAAGSFSFTVTDKISTVKIYIGQYSGKSVSVKINGQTYSVTKNSDSSEYDCFEVDTSVTKTVTIETVKPSGGDLRARIDKIEFWGVDTGAAANLINLPVADLPHKDN